MDIDSVGPSAGGASGVGGNPSSAQTGTPAVVMTPLQLEIPGQDMMDVEPGFSGGQFLASGGAAHVAPLASSSPISSVPGGVASPSQGTRAIPPTTGTHPGCTSPSVPNPINHSAHVASPSFSAPALDAAGVVGLRPVPAPPVVVLTKSDVHAMPKLKLHELFVQWLVKPDNTAWLNSILDDVRSGKDLALSLRPSHTPAMAPASPASPASPVSRLIHSHIPFGGSPRLVRHPNSGGAAQHLSPSHTTVSADLDIGQSSVDRTAVFSSASASVAPGRLGGGDTVPLSVQGGVASQSASQRNPSTKLSASAADQQTDALDSVADGIAGMKADPNGKQIVMPMADVNSERTERALVNDHVSVPSVTDSPQATSRLVSSGPGTASSTEKVSEPASALKDGDMEACRDDSLDLMDAESSPAAFPSGNLPPRPSVVTNGSAKPASTSRRRREIGQFYFPRGRGADEREMHEWEAIHVAFAKCRAEKGGVEGVTRTELASIIPQTLSLPSFFAPIIFDRILQSSGRSEGGDGSEPMTTANSGSEGPGNEPLRGEDEASAAPVGSESPSMNIDNGAAGTSVVAAGAARDVPNNSAATGSVVTEAVFREYYVKESRSRSRESRLFHTLLPVGEERDYLVTNDFKALLRALLLCHQGLSFLHATPEFQLRYSETVVERVFFSCTRKHNGRLTLEDIKRSRLLDTLMTVDEEEDINRERKYFSYEHFYVLYCRFWELDTDHDLQIDREDLMRYGGHSLTYRIVDRIFGGYPRRLDNPEHPGFMSYTDFIWFCLSEEDKNSETAIDYWYRCIDMDGDGLITMYDMEYFYKEQLHRMECFGHEPVQIRDILCQLLDMIKPNCQPPHVKRSDLKVCRLAGNFFNVLFNLNKFFALEARDPLQIRQEHATPELTDWDRFAALEYLRLSAEEEGDEDESWEEVGEAANPLIVEAPF